MNCFRRILVTF